MRAIFYVVVAVLFSAGTTSAQTINKTEEGNIALSQCYSRCMDIGLQFYNRDRQDFYWLAEQEVAVFGIGGTSDDVDTLIQILEPLWCLDFQNEMYTLERCQVGCRDLELIYPDSSTFVRSRFMRAYTEWRDQLIEVGLWTSYADSPEYGSPEFDRACDRYWSDTDGESARAREGASSATHRKFRGRR